MNHTLIGYIAFLVACAGLLTTLTVLVRHEQERVR